MYFSNICNCERIFAKTLLKTSQKVSILQMVMTIGLEAQLRRHLRTREAHIFPHVFPHDDRSDVSNRTLRVRLIPPKKGLISTVDRTRCWELGLGSGRRVRLEQGAKMNDAAADVNVCKAKAINY